MTYTAVLSTMTYTAVLSLIQAPQYRVLDRHANVALIRGVADTRTTPSLISAAIHRESSAVTLKCVVPYANATVASVAEHSHHGVLSASGS